MRETCKILTLGPLFPGVPGKPGGPSTPWEEKEEQSIMTDLEACTGVNSCLP